MNFTITFSREEVSLLQKALQQANAREHEIALDMGVKPVTAFAMLESIIEETVRHQEALAKERTECKSQSA